MTAFTQKSFSVAMGQNDAYRDNFDRAFAKKLDSVEILKEELNALHVEFAQAQAKVDALKANINAREAELKALAHG